MRIEKADRLKKLPPYLFAQIDRAKRQAQTEGRDIINLGVGDPDQPPPQRIIAQLCAAANQPDNHHYALDAGLPALRQAIARWYQKRFGVTLDTDKEILPLIGSKEGLAHLPLGLVNPGDTVLIPEPGYPVYRSATIFAQGLPVNLALLEENNFLPQLEQISKKVLKRTKLFFLNYPNNPTAAIAPEQFFAKLVEFARQHNIFLVQDAAYSEITFDGYKSPSLLQVKQAKDLAVEFYSFSKTYNMAGWRIGWACGNREIIAALAQVKANIDSGIFAAIQIAAIEALGIEPEYLQQVVDLYRQRRDILCQGLEGLGWRAPRPKATFYIWTRLPKAYKDSLKFAQLLLEQADVMVTPGVGFGPSGEGYIRMALTVSQERLQEAVVRIKKVI